MPSTPIPKFNGFPKQGIEILKELPRRDKAWLDDWRGLYEESLLLPAKALVGAIGERIQNNISSTIVAKPAINGSISPIYRDLRFSEDKTVFKDNLMLSFWDGSPKKTAPTLRVRITPDQIGFATGALFVDQPRLDQWRETVVRDSFGHGLERAVDALMQLRPIDIPGPELKRIPKPLHADHPRSEFLRRKSLQLRWSEKTPNCIHQPRFSDWCAERLEHCKTVHLWLREHLS